MFEKLNFMERLIEEPLDSQKSKRQKNHNHVAINTDFVSVFTVLIENCQVGTVIYSSFFFRVVPLVCKSLLKLMEPLFPFYKRIYDFSTVIIQYHTLFEPSEFDSVVYLPHKICVSWRPLSHIALGPNIYRFLNRGYFAVAFLPERYFYSLNASVDL